MDFKYVKKVESKDSIIKFENKINQQIPNPLKEYLVKHNYGFPVKNHFCKNSLDFHVKCLLSLNENDDENIFKFYDYTREDSKEIGIDYIPFAIDNYGNIIAYIPDSLIVVFVDDETLEISNTKDDIDTFFEDLA